MKPESYTCSTPQLQNLELLIEKLDQGEQHLNEQQYAQVANSLKWLHNMLSARRGYQKKQQTKKKLMMQALNKLLTADELERLKEAAAEETFDNHNTSTNFDVDEIEEEEEGEEK